MTNLAISLLIGVLSGAGVYLVLRAQTFPVVLGLTLMSYGVNLFLFTMGRLHTAAPAVVGATEKSTDALPQALVLTAIVIAFAMTAFVIVLALKARAAMGNDHVDGTHIPRAEQTSGKQEEPRG
ncbi:MAG: Na+/H+ antiporter subunit C [Guyparkeria sp.]|uniref:Na+/H+ antiporter subunit C n=1 Tax=Guyparkeria sp. TaxID=2035736 RepID=UPI00397D757F